MTATIVVECKKCGSNDYRTNGTNRNGSVRYRCRPCHNENNKLYDLKNPEKSKARRKRYAESGRKKNLDLQKLYGITLNDYNEMLEEQKSCCKICSMPETVIDKRTNTPRDLAVDHCHDSGKVRGLLCQKCNQAIGLFREDKEIMIKAIKYLGDNYGS